MATTLNPVACGWFLVLAFVLAGMAQTAWFTSSVSRRFAQPLDAGAMLRGRRLFGSNKTWRGFVVMVPAPAVSFALLAGFAGDPAPLGLWRLSIGGYAAAGAIAGFGFMAGELPNSFIKRQLDITPGNASRGPLAYACQFAIDRLDSAIGMLLALRLVVAVPWQTAALVLIVGPFIHWTFSALMYRLGLKPRLA
jgi:CDP-2,3-bis-(O-geranylgeranyl)-sn-glycerol synthase